MALLDDNSRFVKKRMDTKGMGIVHFSHLALLFAVLLLGIYMENHHKGYFGDWKILAYFMPFLILGAAVFSIRLKMPFFLGLVLSSLIILLNLLLSFLIFLDWFNLPELFGLKGSAQLYFVIGIYVLMYALSVEFFVYLKHRKVITL